VATPSLVWVGDRAPVRFRAAVPTRPWPLPCIKRPPVHG
jgi:hypothetical protein